MEPEGERGPVEPQPSVTNSAAGIFGDPVIQARDIHGGVHVHAAAKTPVVPRQLPTDVADFVGRSEAQDLLHTLLNQGGLPAGPVVISAIDGAAGIGKTALAVHWAHSVRELFPDGDLCINLHGYDFKSPVRAEEALDSFLRALGVPPRDIPADLDTKSSLYRSILHRRKFLIILDNAATVDQVEPLLPGGGPSLVLITSRSRLSGLAAKYSVKRLSLDLLGREEAVDLLRRLLGAEVVNREESEAAALVELAARLPLAIRIVSEIARAAPYTGLREVSRELSSGSGDIDSFQTEDGSVKLSAVFDQSYRLLNAQDARVFRLLGLHPGESISAGAAAALVGLDSATLRRSLRRLAGVHLVEEDEKGRFSFHDLLRVYAQSRSRTDESVESQRDAFSRLAMWYLCSASAANVVIMPQRAEMPMPNRSDVEPMRFDHHVDAVSWCELERVAIRLIIKEAADRGMGELSWMLAVTMRGFYNLRKHWSDWLATHEVALEAARAAGNRYGQGRALNGLGTVLHQTGRPAEAVRCHEAAVNLRLSISDNLGAASALDSLGHAYREQNNPLKAAECFQSSLSLRKELGDAHGQAWSLNNLGELSISGGNVEEAVDLLLRSYELRVKVGDAWGGGRTLHNLGICAHSLGESDQARQYFGDAIAWRQEIHDMWGTAQSLAALGDIELELNNEDLAIQHWNAAYEILAQLSDPYAEKLRLKIDSQER